MQKCIACRWNFTYNTIHKRWARTCIQSNESNKDRFKKLLRAERLDTHMRVGEGGVTIVEFNPDPYIQKWYEDEVRR